MPAMQQATPPVSWDAATVRALRDHLCATQRELAEQLGVRQQTVSEWETGAYQPRGAARRLLMLVAERAGFRYDPSPPDIRRVPAPEPGERAAPDAGR